MNASQDPRSNSNDNSFEEGSTWLFLEDTTTSSEDSGAVLSFSSQVINTAVKVLWYVVPPLLLVLGTFGNVMIVVVMRGMRTSSSTACLFFYFIALAVSDQVQLLTAVTYIWVHRVFTWPQAAYRFSLLCYLPKFLWNFSSFTSVWFLVAMTFQRVTAVVAPHRVGVLCTVRRGKVIVTIISTLALALHGQYFFTWVYSPERGRCFYIARYRHIVETCEWLDLAFYSVLPFLFLTSGNAVLIWHVVRSVKFSEKMKVGAEAQDTEDTSDKIYSLSKTMILTSASFLALTLPICIYGITLQMISVDTSDVNFQAAKSLIYTFVAFMWMSSCGVNFYVYLLSGKRFQEEAKKHICWRPSINQAK